MTLPSTTPQPPAHSHRRKPNTTSETTTAAQHYARQSNTSPEPRTRATRSRDSHLCITICGSGPASGQPNAPQRANDLRGDLHKIVSVAGWSRWC